MPDPLDNSAPFDDDQGTRISNKPAPDVSEPTGAGAEATEGTQGEPKGRSHEHRSGYGGKGGEPVESNDIPTSRR
jgi:hypothetical protein